MTRTTVNAGIALSLVGVLASLVRPALADDAPGPTTGKSSTHSSAAQVRRPRRPANLAIPAEARRFLESYAAFPRDGKRDCNELSQTHPSLGALARWYGAQANAKHAVRCKPMEGRRSSWACEALFIHNSHEDSTQDLALWLGYEVNESTIAALDCYLAG
jgi:hypothetical protein